MAIKKLKKEFKRLQAEREAWEEEKAQILLEQDERAAADAQKAELRM